MKRKSHILIIILSGLLTFVSTINLLAQERNYSGITNYPLSTYKANPQNWGIVEDHRGMMYFANQDGFVLEYDGIEWRKIQVPELTSVRSIGIDSQGTIYVGTINNFGYLAPDLKGTLRYVSLIHLVDLTERNFGEIWSIATNKDEVFFQAWDVLFRLKGGIIKIWHLTDLYHRSFVVHNKFYVRQKWIGITVLEDDSLKLINGGEQFAEKTISAMVPFSENKILIGTRTKGLFIYDPGTTSKPISKFENDGNEFLIENKLYHGININDDDFAFTTIINGIIIINKEGKVLRKINKSHSLISEAAYFLHCQDENILWIAQENGISKVLINHPLKYKKESIGSSVNDIVRFNQKLYLATTQGVAYLDTLDDLSKNYMHRVKELKEMTWQFLDAQLPINKNNTVFVNKLLLAHSNGVYEIVKNLSFQITESKSAFCLHQAKKDPSIIFIGTKDGIQLLNWDYKTRSWTTSLIFSDINSEIRYIAEDKENSLWIATMYQGIYRISFNKTKSGDNKYIPDYTCKSPYKLDHFSIEHGLPSNKQIICYPFQGDVLFTSGKELFKYNKSSNRFTPDSRIHPILAKKFTNLFRLKEDSYRNIWIDSDMIFYKQPDNSYIIDTLSLKKVNHLRIDAVYPEKNGITWFGGDGLYKYNSSIKPNIKIKYPALVRKVSLQKDSIIFGGTNFNESNQVCIEQTEMLKPTIDHKFNSITLEYSALFYEEEESLEFSYKLENFDKKWSPWSKETKKEYTNLFEGDYIFKVKSKNIYDIESTVATYSFKISPPVYRAIGAYFLYVTLFIFIIYIAIRINEKRLKAANIRLEQQVRERTEEIAAQRNALAVANATKDKFFSIISHDLKSPFNSILGFGEVMLENISTLSKEKMEKYVSQMYNSSKQLYSLVENLLEWSRSKTGVIHNLPEKLNLLEVINKTLSVSKISAKKKNIQFIKNVDETLIVFADKNLVSTVIRNLLSNAIKYSEENSSIDVSSKVNKDFAEVSITDSGIGIKEEDLKKLFREDIHFTTTGTNKEKGTGLGLILCKEFTEINGGKIWVESEKGKGTTFSFTIPLSV